MNSIEQRIQELGITLPAPFIPKGNYLPYVVSRGLVYIAGQGPRFNGGVQFSGKVGRDLTVEQGYQAARLCALNIISQLREACDGDFTRVVRAARVAGLVNCLPDFTEHPLVINGASDLLFDVFGEKGRHARIASGAVSLPFNMAVEVEAIFEIAVK